MTTIKRLKMLDVLRGFAILCMAFFHAYNVFEPPPELITPEAETHFMIYIFQFFARWAGLFVCISGFAFIYVSLHKLKLHPEKKGKSIKKLIVNTLFYALILMVLEISVHALFGAGYQGGGIYNANEGPYHRSLILGSIETGEFQIPDLYMLFYSTGILSILAVCLISLVLLLWTTINWIRLDKVLIVLILWGTLGTIIVVSSEFVVNYLRPIWVANLVENRFIPSVVLGYLVGDVHALLPLLGFAIYGGIFGLMAWKSFTPKKLFVITAPFAFSYCTSGSILYLLLGAPPNNQILRTTPVQMTFLQIGLVLLLLSGVYRIDYYGNLENPSRSSRLIKKYQIIEKKLPWAFLTRFSDLSLTIFLMEAFLATIIKVLILNPLFSGWATNILWINLYAIFLMILWNILAIFWGKVEYKGSFGWMIKQLKKVSINKKKNM
jgi:hypothetical protein